MSVILTGIALFAVAMYATRNVRLPRIFFHVTLAGFAIHTAIRLLAYHHNWGTTSDPAHLKAISVNWSFFTGPFIRLLGGWGAIIVLIGARTYDPDEEPKPEDAKKTGGGEL